MRLICRRCQPYNDAILNFPRNTCRQNQSPIFPNHTVNYQEATEVHSVPAVIPTHYSVISMQL